MKMENYCFCCGMSNNDPEGVLGDILEMSSDDIYQQKISSDFYQKSVSSGVPFAVLGNKLLSLGGGSSYLGLSSQLFVPHSISTASLSLGAKIVKKLPGGIGVKIVRKLKTTIGKIG